MTERYFINGKEVDYYTFTSVADSNLELDIPFVDDPIKNVRTFSLTL